MEGWRERGTAKGFPVSFGDDENVLELIVMVAKNCDYTKTHYFTCCKRLNFISCE